MGVILEPPCDWLVGLAPPGVLLNADLLRDGEGEDEDEAEDGEGEAGIRVPVIRHLSLRHTNDQLVDRHTHCGNNTAQ